MPANLHVFLLKYLKILRLHIPKIYDPIQNSLRYLGYPTHLMTGEIDGNKPTIQMTGYANTFVLNLLVVIFIASFLLVALIVARICDSCFQRRGDRRLAAWLQNFILRFIYEFFFEICLCSLIHIGLSQEVKTESPLYFWSVSVLSMLTIVVFVASVSSFFLHGGPYATNTFR